MSELVAVVARPSARDREAKSCEFWPTRRDDEVFWVEVEQDDAHRGAQSARRGLKHKS